MVIDIVMYGALIALFVIFAVYFIKTKDFLDVVKAKYNKLAIVTDEGSRTIHFYPVNAKGNVSYLKGHGIKLWDRQATYLDPVHKCQVGIFNSSVAVGTPLEFAKALEEGKTEQLTLKGFEQWLSKITNSYVWEEELESKARTYAGLNDLDKASKDFNLKWLLIIGGIAIVIFVVLSIVAG